MVLFMRHDVPIPTFDPNIPESRLLETVPLYYNRMETYRGKDGKEKYDFVFDGSKINSGLGWTKMEMKRMNERFVVSQRFPARQITDVVALEIVGDTDHKSYRL